MPVLSSAVVGAVDLLPGQPETRTTPTQVQLSTIRLLAKLPTIAAYAYKKSLGQPFLYPDNSLGLIENFLRMMFGVPGRAVRGRPGDRPARSTCCSSCTPTTSRTARRRPCAWSAPARPTCSRRSRPASTRCAGPLHGGANQAVLEMLEQIRDDGGDVDDVRAAGQEQGGRRPADGLRPPRLQELRPARRDHQEDRRRVLGDLGAATSCSTSPCSSRRSRSPTTTSSSASSTRTSTSTRASSTGRWASRRGCSPCCSRSAGCPAGSRTGGR